MLERNTIERDLAKRCADAVNSFTFKDEAFCKTMLNEHKTLQQSFTRLCVAWLETLDNSPDWYFDGRNEAARNAAKVMVKAYRENDCHLPLV